MVRSCGIVPWLATLKVYVPGVKDFCDSVIENSFSLTATGVAPVAAAEGPAAAEAVDGAVAAPALLLPQPASRQAPPPTSPTTDASLRVLVSMHPPRLDLR